MTPSPVLRVPPGQAAQRDGVCAISPGAQARQTDAPGVVETRPGPQVWQAAVPPGEAVPAGHAEQIPGRAGSDWLPAGQGTQEAAPAAGVCPPGHGVQDAAPPCDTAPAGQGVQALVVALAKVPAGQSVQVSPTRTSPVGQGGGVATTGAVWPAAGCVAAGPVWAKAQPTAARVMAPMARTTRFIGPLRSRRPAGPALR